MDAPREEVAAEVEAAEVGQPRQLRRVDGLQLVLREVQLLQVHREAGRHPQKALQQRMHFEYFDEDGENE